MDDVQRQRLAVGSGLAAFVAAVSAANPGVGIAASAAQPFLQTAFERWQAVQGGRATRALGAAADRAGIPEDEVVERLTADPELITLLAAALNAASNTAREDKIGALGRSLGALAADKAQVDTEQLWVRIFEGIDAPHIRVLQELLNDGPEGPGHRRMVRPADLGHFIKPAAMALAVLQTLERYGLAQRPDLDEIHAQTRAAYGVGPSTMQRVRGVYFAATALADECVDRLTGAGDATSN